MSLSTPSKSCCFMFHQCSSRSRKSQIRTVQLSTKHTTDQTYQYLVGILNTLELQSRYKTLSGLVFHTQANIYSHTARIWTTFGTSGSVWLSHFDTQCCGVKSDSPWRSPYGLVCHTVECHAISQAASLTVVKVSQ